MPTTQEIVEAQARYNRAKKYLVSTLKLPASNEADFRCLADAIGDLVLKQGEYHSLMIEALYNKCLLGSQDGC